MKNTEREKQIKGGREREPDKGERETGHSYVLVTINLTDRDKPFLLALDIMSYLNFEYLNV